MRTLFTLTSQDQSSRVAGAIALVLAASVGLAVALLVPERRPQDSTPPVESALVRIDEEGRMPETDSRRLVDFYSRHLTSQRSFVIFRNGSVVLIAEPCDDPLGKAREILDRCAEPDARFLTEQTGEGDLIVTFREAVLHWTPRAELEPLQKWASKNLGGLLSDAERASMRQDWMPPADARVGLVARKRMLEDARESKVLKVLRAKPPVSGE